ncbi:hypothetical protein D6850_15550 [Roseovarius spongiae]|uniref:Arylsulfatase n=1 Tax=Roseovarius spongiae TaxID=2320272 RepID=A0A3A8AQX5_9RHOB|nr:hypothetical protein [Roseovarius spongiae]RKF12918.1 hypothetical protein D6850_15550 [Roseovarius spongiae]
MTLTLLHTAETHRATFNALRDRIAPGAKMSHLVRPDWLARARNGVDVALEDEIARAVADAPGRVLCSCTTLGPAAAKTGALRVDAPMMQAAAQGGGTILMAYCLHATREPSLALLGSAISSAGSGAVARPLMIEGAWPLFEAGNTSGFHIRIAEAVAQEAANIRDLGSIVLAQASMSDAAKFLDGIGVPVLTSPELALRAALGG